MVLFHSEKTKKKISNTMKKKKIHCGKDNPMCGVKPSNYKHGLKSKCIGCKKTIYYKAKRCKSCSKRLDKNPNWVNGKSFEPYPNTWCNQLKELIRKRDNYKCRICKITQKKLNRKLDVHHIDYDKHNIKPNNLISLCKSCHTKTNFNRSYWIKYFTNIDKYKKEQQELGII